jgi:homoserine O-acetyltransferase/O-succinyltransferase
MPIRGVVAATLPLVFACSLDAARAPECPAVAAAPSAAQGLATTSVQPSSQPPPLATVPAEVTPAPLLPVASDPEPALLGKIGDLPLENGEIIQDCQVEYRILGAANADKSNVVVWATWFSGITKDLVGLVGPGKLVDSSHYQVVLVGALANGVSSSPSNSPQQPRARFPTIGIRDMVESQHRLLTRVLGFSHVRAVMGISMGGMQTFQWGVSYPGFMDRLIPLVGSPRLAPYDLLLWQASLDAIQQNPAYAGGNYREQPVLSVVQQLSDLNLTTPQAYNKALTREQVLDGHDHLAPPRFDANDRVRQLRAMMSHDVSKAFAGSLDAAAHAIKAKLLVVVNEHDAMVTPGPALDFARRAKAPPLILKGDCGHKATSCEEATIAKRVAAALK